MNEITRIIYFVFIQGKGTFIHLYVQYIEKMKFSRYNKINFFIYIQICLQFSTKAKILV